jgi:hypothetical protein
MIRRTLNVSEGTYLAVQELRIRRMRELGRSLTADEVLRELLAPKPGPRPRRNRREKPSQRSELKMAPKIVDRCP